MKNKILRSLAAVVLLSTFNSQLSTAHAQGLLTPPGAPAPTMKTLAQIEPRTPISSLPYTVSQPGSYYFTTNLTETVIGGGILIISGNVTLDLNGFTLAGVNSDKTNGITISGSLANITVRNGSISGWGGAGVDGYLFAPNSINELFEHLSVSGNNGNGISASHGSLIHDCLSFGNVAGGASGGGLVTYGGVIRDCVSRGNSYYGILVLPGLVTGCLVQNNLRSGIYVDQPNSTITQNTCTGNDTGLFANQAGIYINDSNNCIEGNTVAANLGAGIQVNSPTYVNNVVIKNVVSGSSPNNYLGTASNDFGPVGTAATSTSPWGNISH